MFLTRARCASVSRFGVSDSENFKKQTVYSVTSSGSLGNACRTTPPKCGPNRPPLRTPPIPSGTVPGNSLVCTPCGSTVIFALISRSPTGYCTCARHRAHCPLIRSVYTSRVDVTIQHEEAKRIHILDMMTRRDQLRRRCDTDFWKSEQTARTC